MTLEFRPALRTDRDAVETLLRSAFTPYARKLGRTDGPGPYDWVAAAIGRGDVFVASEDNALIGAVTTNWRSSELAIDHIAVEPGSQGRGVGSWLLDSVEGIARNRGATALSLYTAEIMDDQIRLYRRHGFVEVHRGPPPHGKDAVLRVFMAKPI